MQIAVSRTERHRVWLCLPCLRVVASGSRDGMPVPFGGFRGRFVTGCRWAFRHVVPGCPFGGVVTGELASPDGLCDGG